MTTYDEAIAYLLSLEAVRGWDLGLDRMRAMLARRGHPERRFAAVHIAGTNGKGSTAAIVERVLRAAGHRTGLYTSPHLVDFTERVRAGGAAIPPATVVELVSALRADGEAAGIPLTHFEFVTLLAFEWFATIGVEVAVVEVGLGGRLDATNVLAPLVTVVTSIARDHEAFLGDTIEAIAGEKAGIAKPGVPLVLGPGLPPAAETVIRSHAAAVGAPVIAAGTFERTAGGWRFASIGGVAWEGPALGLPGMFQLANAATALTTLAAVAPRFRISEATVREGLAQVEWPGRLAIVQRQPLVVLDGAHNPAGATALAAELPGVVGSTRAVLLFAVMADKHWPEMLASLVPFAERVILTQVGRRGLDPAVVAAHLDPAVPVETVLDATAAVRAAVTRAGPDGAVVVAGSLFLVGATYAALLGADARLFPEWHGW